MTYQPLNGSTRTRLTNTAIQVFCIIRFAGRVFYWYTVLLLPQRSFAVLTEGRSALLINVFDIPDRRRRQLPPRSLARSPFPLAHTARPPNLIDYLYSILIVRYLSSVTSPRINFCIAFHCMIAWLWFLDMYTRFPDKNWNIMLFYLFNFISIIHLCVYH